jgi:hypothetical protein
MSTASPTEVDKTRPAAATTGIASRKCDRLSQVDVAVLANSSSESLEGDARAQQQAQQRVVPPDLLLTAMNRALTLVLAGQPTVVSMRDQRLDDLDPRDLGIDQVVVDVEELRLDEGPQLAERRTPHFNRPLS